LRSKNNPGAQLDTYTQGLKEAMINSMSNMGYDTFAVQDLIEEKGIVENSMDLCCDLMNNPNYVNPLKVQRAP